MKTTLQREAYEDNAGGLFVVDQNNKVIAWGAEYSLNSIDKNNNLQACLTESLYDWTCWANATDSSEGYKDAEGNLLTYDDYIKWLQSATCVAIIVDNKITLYPTLMGTNAKKWAQLNSDDDREEIVIDLASDDQEAVKNGRIWACRNGYFLEKESEDFSREGMEIEDNICHYNRHYVYVERFFDALKKSLYYRYIYCDDGVLGESEEITEAEFRQFIC